jgi:hypothetical protein
VASAEEFIIKLTQQVDGPADKASAALNKLESAIRKEAAALASAEASIAAQGASLNSLSSQLQTATDAWRTMAYESDKSKEAEAAVKAQAREVMALQRQVDKASEAYAKMQQKAASSSANLGALKGAAPEFEQLSEKAKAAGAAQEAHAKKMQGFAEAAKGAKGATDDTGKAVDMLKDKMPQLDGNLGKAQQALAKLGPAGVAAAAAFAVIVIAVTAVIGAFVKLVAAAISISQTRDALAATFSALSTGAESGEELVAAMDDVAMSLPFTEARVNAWAKALMGAGLEGETLAGRVRGVASATALMGDEGGAAAENLFKKLASGGQAADEISKAIKAGGGEAAEQLAKMGVRASDLAKALGTTPDKMKTMTVTATQLGDALQKALTEKGAGSLESMSLTWESITGKLGDAWDDMFKGLGDAVEPFMSAVRDLFSEFAIGSTAQVTTKEILVAVFTEVFAVATKVVNFIHKGFLMVEIAAFKVATAMLPIIRIIMAIATNSMVLDGLIFILKTIGVVILAIAAPLAIVTAAFWAIGAVVFAVLSAIVGAILWCVGDAVRAFGVMGTTISTWASGAASAAGNFVMGIVNGISTGASLVVDAVKNLASSAMSAFTGFFKIKSPSQLMADTAVHIPGGAAVGIEAGTGDVVEAMEGMGDAGMSGASKGFAKPGGTKSGGGGDTHYHVTVEYSGKREDNPGLAAQIRDILQQASLRAQRAT